MRLLGGEFEFECGSSKLQRLVDWAYGGLPRHKLAAVAPRFRVRLALAPRDRPRPQADPSRIEMLSGAGLLCGTTSSSDFAVLSPEHRAALVVVSRDMLRFPYHTRYELIEFAVFTLAARAQALMPLHAACVGHASRGLLLIGESGAGKSTASLHCLLRGLDFLAEDSVFVTPDTLLATGVANFLHVRRDALHFVPAAAASVIRRSPVIRRRSGESHGCRIHFSPAGSPGFFADAAAPSRGCRAISEEPAVRRQSSRVEDI
ncbi:MAG: serine kinase [Gammaproteobacteria bacterium]|nr:MAG: serine kinase [Gammaproteobacteria bacterium]